MAKLVSKTYGEALFELAVEEGKEDAFLEEIIAFKEVLKENPDFNKLMNHPKILKEEKQEVLDNVFKGRISDELAGFLHLIINKDRYGDIDAILDYFIDEVKKLKGIGVAYVTTAIPLGTAKQKEIEEKLLSTTSYKQMEMHYQVDEELIGGMVIRIGDRVVDSSIKTRLFELRRQLLKTRIDNS
ncbi:MAG: F0F1 ATP synthase subunit delta [Lachnospiraceae bacterium]|nr:F0F1 ATP synthase subunit delta [Lachnospiraceae bacterium]